MVRRLTKDRLQYTFSPFHSPALTIKPRESFIVETEDSSGGVIKEEGDLHTYHIKRRYRNPVTGPIYVEGVEAGDTLIVNIEDVKVKERGYTLIRPGGGALGEWIPGPRIKFCSIKDGKVFFSDKIHLPLKPLIGTIGTAPEIEAIASIKPGPHGGNMDCQDVTTGNKLFLPVQVPGALLALGDVHAVQGDGEVGGVAVEVSAEVTLSLNLIKGMLINWPRLESVDSIMTIGSAKPLEEAAKIAFKEMILWLEEDYSFVREEAYQLCTNIATLKICQIVNPLYTVEAIMPKKYLC